LWDSIRSPSRGGKCIGSALLQITRVNIRRPDWSAHCLELSLRDPRPVYASISYRSRAFCHPSTTAAHRLQSRITPFSTAHAFCHRFIKTAPIIFNVPFLCVCLLAQGSVIAGHFVRIEYDSPMMELIHAGEEGWSTMNQVMVMTSYWVKLSNLH
jgi:hypothetical protein